MLIQVVPHLPPPEEGVGGTARALGERLAQRGIQTRIVALKADRGGPSSAMHLLSSAIPPDAEALTDAIKGATAVLLHYSNYGYHPRGCPTWLVDGIERWKQSSSRARLWTYFHEIYATGPPWRSSFWLGSQQRELAKRLALASDHILTSLRLYRDLLAELDIARDVVVRPIVSAIGEPTCSAPIASRARRIVVFGGPGVRKRAYGPALPGLLTACHALGTREIVDIGPGRLRPQLPASLEWRQAGELPAAQVRDLLGDSMAGFLAYPQDFLPKSSVFAAYCAHGVLAVCSGKQSRLQEGLTPGLHYWDPERGPVPADLQALARSAHAWYDQHSLERWGEEIAARLRSRP